MSSLDAVCDIIIRAVSLFVLTLAPPFFSPAPAPSASPRAEAALAAVVVVVLVAAALRLRQKLASRQATIGAALLVGSVVAAIACAAVFRGARGPIGRGVIWVALPLWAGLAVIVGEVAERGLGDRFRHKRLTGAVVVACAGVSLLAAGSKWLFSPPEMWWDALRKDGSNGAALDAVLREPMAKRDQRAAMAVLDQCLSVSPGSCACLTRRANVGLRVNAVDQALADARAAVARCGQDPATRTALVAVLAYKGDGAEAESEARKALTTREDPQFHYALALAHDRLGRRAEALEEAKRAVAGNAGRDASLLLGALAINANELDVAEKALEPLVTADPNDAEALYDLGLVFDRKNLYNKARERYLAALRAYPNMADARFNLALLTLRHGVLDEAKHHAKKLSEIAPNDPRNAQVARMIASAPPPKGK